MSSEKYQTKSTTPVDDYVCNLSPDLVEILENELRETKETRDHGIKALRDWTMQNPKILKTRLDSIWLLKHLRFKKYSIPAAQEAIERHLVLRQGIYGSQFFHAEADVLRPCVKKFFDANPVCILPDRDKSGHPVVLWRLQNIKPSGSECLAQDILTGLKCLFETLGEIEEFHIRGVVYIIDLSGITASYMKIMPLEHVIKIGKNAEKCSTGRQKGVHIINVSPTVTYIANLFLSHAPEKARDRVKFYKSFKELTIVDKKSLPKEYGGTIPMAEMAQSLWDLVLKDRDLQMSYTKMQVDERMYPKACFEGSVAVLKVRLNSDNLFEEAKRCGNDAIFGVQGSFRKLEID